MIGIKDIEVGKPYMFENTIIYVTERVRHNEYKTISIVDHIHIDYDDSIWFDRESYFHNDECFLEISEKEFVDFLRKATFKIIKYRINNKVNMITDVCPECGGSRAPSQKNIFGEPRRLTHACSECNGMYYRKVNIKTDSMTVSEFIIKDSGSVSEDSTLIDWRIDNDFVITSKWVLEDGETFEEEHCPGAFIDWIVRGRTRY